MSMHTEGMKIARNFGCKFIETSAKSHTNVKDAFYGIVREIRRYNRDMSGSPSGHAQLNGPGKMEMDEHGKKAGCCGGCVII